MEHKVYFTLPSTDFKTSISKALTVKSTIDKQEVINGDIEYSVVIPDYIFNELADTEEQFSTTYDQNNRKISGLFSKRTLTHKFQRTQTCILISRLQEYISSLTQHILDKHSVETNTMTKKIFIAFNHSETQTRNDLNGAYTGEKISQSFKYFTGYEVMTDKFSGIKRKVEKRYISKILYASELSVSRKQDTGYKEQEDLFLTLTNQHESIEEFEQRYSIIDWSEEREAFCERIKQAFMKVNNELSSFLKNLDEDKINALMQNGSGLKFLTEK